MFEFTMSENLVNMPMVMSSSMVDFVHIVAEIVPTSPNPHNKLYLLGFLPFQSTSWAPIRIVNKAN